MQGTRSSGPSQWAGRVLQVTRMQRLHDQNVKVKAARTSLSPLLPLLLLLLHLLPRRLLRERRNQMGSAELDALDVLKTKPRVFFVDKRSAYTRSVGRGTKSNVRQTFLLEAALPLDT
jgi:hypothetical protein